ncbi:hypothetical protein Hanom_Chr12g01125881 [Helianthus anomalus]
MDNCSPLDYSLNITRNNQLKCEMRLRSANNQEKWINPAWLHTCRLPCETT